MERSFLRPVKVLSTKNLVQFSLVLTSYRLQLCITECVVRELKVDAHFLVSSFFSGYQRQQQAPSDKRDLQLLDGPASSTTTIFLDS